MKAEELQVYALGAGVLLVGVLALKLTSAGGAASVGTAVGSAAVGAVTGVTTGVVSGVSEVVGIPTPLDTTTDAKVARWMIDTQGYWTASLWCGVPAMWNAAQMEPGTGTPPPAGSQLAQKFGTAPTVKTAVPATTAPVVDTSIYDQWEWNLY